MVFCSWRVVVSSGFVISRLWFSVSLRNRAGFSFLFFLLLAARFFLYVGKEEKLCCFCLVEETQRRAVIYLRATPDTHHSTFLSTHLSLPLTLLVHQSFLFHTLHLTVNVYSTLVTLSSLFHLLDFEQTLEKV